MNDDLSKLNPDAASTTKTAWQTTARAALCAAGVEWEEPNG